MATKQTRHWYDRVEKTEKLPKGAWQSQYVARKLEKFSREGYRLVKVTNDMYSFDETEPAERKYFVMNINGYDKKSKKNPAFEWREEIEPYVKRFIADEPFRIVAELDPEKLDDEYYFLQMRKMKKGFVLPIAFMVYALAWVAMAVYVMPSYGDFFTAVAWSMIAAAFGYGLVTMGTILWEIHRIKQEWIDTI